MSTQYKLVKRAFFARVFSDFHRTHDRVVDHKATQQSDLEEWHQFLKEKDGRSCPVPTKRASVSKSEAKRRAYLTSTRKPDNEQDDLSGPIMTASLIGLINSGDSNATRTEDTPRFESGGGGNFDGGGASGRWDSSPSTSSDSSSSSYSSSDSGSSSSYDSGSSSSSFDSSSSY